MKEREKLRNEIEEKIKRNYPEKNILNSYVLQSYIENEIESHPNINLKKNKFFRKNIILTKILSILLFIGMLLFIFSNWNLIIENPEFKYFFIIFCFLLTSFVFFIQGFVQKNEPIITLNEKGINYIKYKYLLKKSEKEILWNDIVVIKLWETLNEAESTKKILIGKTNKEIEEIEITGIDTNPFEFITIIEKRMNNNVA